GRIDRMDRRSSGMYRGPSLLQHYCAASRPPSDGFSDFCLALRCCVGTTSWKVHCASFAQQVCDWRTWSSYWPHGYALQLFSRESLCMSEQWIGTLGVPWGLCLRYLLRNLPGGLGSSLLNGLVGTTSHIDIHLAKL